jgi:hypothetical protein
LTDVPGASEDTGNSLIIHYGCGSLYPQPRHFFSVAGEILQVFDVCNSAHVCVLVRGCTAKFWPSGLLVYASLRS